MTTNSVDIRAAYNQLVKTTIVDEFNEPVETALPEKEKLRDEAGKAVFVKFQSGDAHDQANRYNFGGDVRPPTNVLKRAMVQYDCTIEDAQRYLDLRDDGHSQYAAALMAGLTDPSE